MGRNGSDEETRQAASADTLGGSGEAPRRSVKAKKGSKAKAKAKAKVKAKAKGKKADKATKIAKRAPEPDTDDVERDAADDEADAPVKKKKGDRQRALVIVESPAKAKTIKKYLGPGYTVKASVGHVKDLPKSKISVDIENEFAPHYEVIRGKRKVLKEIKDAARDADVIYLAPDPDREGEAIAWHIREELGKRHAERAHRITFNEITKRAVQEAIKNPRPLDKNRYESQQARRILDRLVGYQISPILWDKVRRGLSAGRVQSVAVRLIVEREREIRKFVAEEYWSIDCLMDGTPQFMASVIKKGEEKFRPGSGDEARRAVAELTGAAYRVKTVTRRERRRKALPPLITSKLQQEGANRLRFTAKRTMMIAQQLYEGVELGEEGSVALITYMRTDSTRISDDALGAVRSHIETTFGKEYLPETPNTYKNKKSAQEAHEAIRPTSLEYPPERVKAFLTIEQFKLYQLIWRWFVSSQMMPAVYDQTTVDIEASQYLLRATGSNMKFPGFLAAFGVGEAVEDEAGEGEEQGAKLGELPVLSDGQPLTCREVKPEQHFTQPPPRYSESSLVKELEDKGIGRPSTYATIMSTIVNRDYVVKNEGRFYPSELGELITELLTTSFPRVLDVEFTAKMEESLDEVEEGKVDWIRLLSDFYAPFKGDLERAATEMRDVKREETPTEHSCAVCTKPMVIKWGRNGSFLACSGYPGCRNTRDYKKRPDGSIEIMPEQTTDKLCPTCSGAMVVKRGRYGEFLACKAYPECKGTRPMPIGVDCPNNCGGYVAQRRSMRGRIFYGCSSYPNCTFASWDRPVAEPCPTCGSKFLVSRWSKTQGLRIKCPNKECLYTREVVDPEEAGDVETGDGLPAGA
jgi:DNA topoisomerase I